MLLVEASAMRAVDPDALLAALHSNDPIPAALDQLTAGGFSAMPAFALVEYRGQSAHYVVRGGVEIAFTGPGGARGASGAGITTWTEQLISGVAGFTVAAVGAAESGAALPLVDGAVWANRVEVTATDAAAESPRAAAPLRAAAEERPDEATVVPDVTTAAPVPAAAPAPAPTAGSGAAAEDTLLAPEESVPFPEGTTGYDHLFGVTVMKSVEAAAVRPHEDEEDAGAESVAPAPVEDAGDHDGLTMMSSDIAELRRRAAAAGGVPVARAEQHGAEPQFRLELPDGRSELLDRPVIVGRSPSASKVNGSELPRLVTVGGTDPDISRSHVRFTVEGGTVVITDLHSRNGTLMSLPGRPPQKLREGEPTSALAGTVVDLGGGIRITITETAAAG